MDSLKQILELLIDPRSAGIIVAFLGVVFSIFKLLILLKKKFNTNKLIREMSFYTESEVHRARKYYIRTQCQSMSPSVANEPGQSFALTPKEPLMGFFLKKVFESSDQDYKYYILLADSGMGKTTFMINLYLTYSNGVKSFYKAGFKLRLLFNGAYKIRLIPLGDKDALNEIERISDDDRSSTILLLDAFDEDNEAVKNHKTRLEKILLATKQFRKVIITCRTQFFANEEEEPYKTGLFKYGGEKGEHLFAKLYISPFDLKDINRYIRKKYFFSRAKKRAAKEIVMKCPHLMMRPMLLNYIDDFLTKSDGNRLIIRLGDVKIIKLPFYSYSINFKYSYQIYESLIGKWIDREASRQVDSKQFGIDLLSFSKEIAIDIYENRFDRGGLFIDLISFEAIARLKNIKIDSLELKSRSLLNRNPEGRYKFSHKSILEFFVAMHAIEDQKFWKKINFEGMDVAQLFIKELVGHKYLNEFYEKYPRFELHYSTIDGLRGATALRDLSMKFMNSVNFIFFSPEYFNVPELRNIIISCFPNLRIFTQKEFSIGDFSRRYADNYATKSELEKMNKLGGLTNETYLLLEDIKEEIDVTDSVFNIFLNFESELLKYVSVDGEPSQDSALVN